MARKADTYRIDLGLCGEKPGGCLGVARENADRVGSRRFPGIPATGLADTALVVCEHGDAVPHEQRLQVG